MRSLRRTGIAALMLFGLTAWAWGQTTVTSTAALRKSFVRILTAPDLAASCVTPQIGLVAATGCVYTCTASAWASVGCVGVGTNPITLTADTGSASGTTLTIAGTNGLSTSGSGSTLTVTQPSNATQSFSSVTSAVLTNPDGTPNVVLNCYDSSNRNVEPDRFEVASSSPYNVTVYFFSPQTGRCVLSGRS